MWITNKSFINFTLFIHIILFEVLYKFGNESNNQKFIKKEIRGYEIYSVVFEIYFKIFCLDI
jgi:hypothetical protein